MVPKAVAAMEGWEGFVAPALEDEANPFKYGTELEEAEGAGLGDGGRAWNSSAISRMIRPKSEWTVKLLREEHPVMVMEAGSTHG